MAQSSTVNSLRPLNLFTLLIYTKCSGIEVLQVRYGVYSRECWDRERGDEMFYCCKQHLFPSQFFYAVLNFTGL